MADVIWLRWEDLTPAEQKQARKSYAVIREQEEDVSWSTAKRRTQDIADKRFQRLPDGYIYVDV